jgi:hypothetical protein
MVILPLCPFPPAYWWKMAGSEEGITDAGEHYVHQSFRNRYRVLGPNGPVVLTVPVEGQKGFKIPVRDIRLSSHGSWRRVHFGTLRAAYGKSAGFEHLEGSLAALYEDTAIRFLADFSMRSLDICGELTGMPVFRFSESYVETTGECRDLRPLFRGEPAWPDPGPYPQVFSDRVPYTAGLSVLDLIMNLGPMAQGRLLLWKTG